MNRRYDWVLVVEDEPDHQLLITEAVRRSGGGEVRLRTVADGADAQALLTEALRDSGGVPGRGLMVLDLGLPRVSGFEVLEWIRDRPELVNITVVVFTASENPLDAEHAFDLGAKGYFQKPADFGRYIEIFRGLLTTDIGSPAE